MIRLKVSTAAAKAMAERIKAGLTPERIDPVIDRVALQTFRSVVEATPKRWFGQVRRGWTIQKPQLGERVIVNTNKIMLWLEEGTANAGTGYIYPKRAKALFLAFTRAAAAGYRKGLVWGVDFVLARRVRGIKPRHIVAKEREKAKVRLFEACKAHIRRLAHG